MTAALIAGAAGCSPDVPSGLGAEGQGPGTAPTESSTATTPDDAGAAPSTPSTPSTPSSVGVDAAAVLASIAQGSYQTSAEFTEITAAAYPSVAAPGSTIREWVSTADLVTYEAVSPGVSGSNVVAPAGMTIVRAVLDEDGGIGKLTLMYKGPQGYNPALGDWWFGVTDPTGSPLEVDGGPELGLLTACYSCHVPRSSDDYLFGVPLNDRVTAGAGAGDDAGTGVTTDASDDAGDDAGDDDAGADADADAGHRRHS
jgi:hypothetical protein